MLVGSYSSNIFGVPRSTKDADFVIEVGEKSLSPLFQSLASDLIFDSQMLLESVTMTLRYVGRHPASGFKVELFMLSSDPFDQERFRRRQPKSFLEATAQLPTPEDVIVQKLRWFERSQRPRDREDVKNVLAVQRGKLDLEYLRGWADQHRTRALLDALLLEVSRLT